MIVLVAGPASADQQLSTAPRARDEVRAVRPRLRPDALRLASTSPLVRSYNAFVVEPEPEPQAETDEPGWLPLGTVGRVRASVTADRHVVLDLEAGPIALGVSNVLDRAWRVEPFEDASRAGTSSYLAAAEPVASAPTALATLTLDY